MLLPEIIYSTTNNKCPHCHKGNVFSHGNPYRFNKPFKMEESCSSCGLKYEREPGFFFGALYVSYALMSGIFIAWFITDLLWLHLEAFTLLGFFVLTVFALFPVVYRWSRLIWLNFFFRFDKKYASKNNLVESH